MSPAHDIPISRDLVLLGGGHSHVAVLRAFGMRPMAGVRLTLISRDEETPYSGMLPGLIAGHYRRDEAHIDLGPLAAFAKARFYPEPALGLDLVNRQVLCAHRPPVPFDVLSMDIGSTPVTAGIPGVTEYALAIKPVDRFLAAWEDLKTRALTPAGPRRVVVVGGGAGGVEVLLAMRHALHTRLELPCGSRGEGFHWRLVTATADILPGHHRRVRDRYRRLLAHRGVAVELNQRVAAVEPRAVVTAAGQRFDADVVVWVTGAQPAPWLADTGLALDERGFIEVDATLESRSHAGVFAAGDVASVVEYPRPKAGVFAVRQGPPLTANLRRALRGQRRRPFAPQRQFLSLISTGDRFAVASRGPVVLAGSWVWRWKDAIDRGFMARYQQLPAMASETPGEETTMRCGGCGAKVDGGLLQNALKACTSHPRGDVVQGFENPDDAAVLRPTPAGTLELYSVDGFRAPLDDPYRVGRIVTHHALSDIYAMGGEPRGALVLAQLPFGPEVQQARTLAMLMAGINGVLTGEGVSLLGGHTGEGPELYVGLAVTGCVEPAALRLKGGLVPGQQLLLTKPLGTGVLLAGHMRGLTKGPWMAAALASMDRSNGNAARALLAAGATAMTDVTGFGVLGHLLEMCRAGGVGARLFIHGLPALPGALSLLERGVASTFALQNQNFMTELQLDDIAPGDPGLALLFDPQTSGGLLAGVPADAVAACRRALAAVGCDCWSIGEVLPAPGAQVPVQLTKAAPLASVLPQAPLTA